jgi:hypothetical protein
LSSQQQVRRNLQLNMGTDMVDTGMVSGPWLCEGMDCQDCASLITSEAPDVIPFIATPGTPVTREFNIRRAIVYVDADCKVQNNPSRG